MQWNLNNVINTQFIINQWRAAQFSKTKIIEFHRQAYKWNGMEKINFPLIITTNQREKMHLPINDKALFCIVIFFIK